MNKENKKETDPLLSKDDADIERSVFDALGAELIEYATSLLHSGRLESELKGRTFSMAKARPDLIGMKVTDINEKLEFAKILVAFEESLIGILDFVCLWNVEGIGGSNRPTTFMAWLSTMVQDDDVFRHWVTHSVSDRETTEDIDATEGDAAPNFDVV